jgi:hypothetical protein
MRVVKTVFLGIAIICLPVFMSACTTVGTTQAEVKTSRSIAMEGDTVHLFYGVNKLAKEEFCLNAIVPVYRFHPPYTSVTPREEVGKIKITGIESEHYLEGIVLEGRIENYDIAVKPNTECLIKIPEANKN